MEQDLDYIFENHTNNTEPYSRPHIFLVQGIMEIIFCLIGFASDAVIIFIMAKSKRMHTRTNLIILNWAIMDGLFVICSPDFLTVLLYESSMNTHETALCVIENVDILYQFGSFVLIFCLMSTTIIKTKKIVDRVLFGVFYGIIVLVFVINTGFCLAGDYMTPVFHYLSFYGIVSVLFCLILKESHNCWRVCRKSPLSQATKFRLNFVRIYVYTWIVCCTFYVFELGFRLHYVLIFFNIFGYMVSAILLYYMAASDRNFKICMLNLITCRWGEYDVDATINFADDCSEEANITFNGTELRNGDLQLNV